MSDDCVHLLHVKATADTVQFIASAAYRMKYKGRLVWGKISEKSEKHSSNRPMFDFLCQKFVTQTLRDSTDYNPDGNHSSFTLLSSDKGRRLYNVACASNGGGRAHQELFWACLVYVDAENTPHLACADGFADVTRKSGTMSIGYGETGLKVYWLDDPAAPFRVTFVNRTFYGYAKENVGFYCELTDGLISGNLPMYRHDHREKYIAGDGKRTLRGLAYLVSRYKSVSIHEVDDRTKAVWLDAFRKANPELEEDKVLPKSVKVMMPDENAVRKSLREAN